MLESLTRMMCSTGLRRYWSVLGVDVSFCCIVKEYTKAPITWAWEVLERHWGAWVGQETRKK